MASHRCCKLRFKVRLCAVLALASFAGAVHIGDDFKQAGLCSSGISNAKGTVCCAKSCGACGGSGCSKRPGGPGKCCSQKFTRQCTDSSDTACTMSDAQGASSSSSSAAAETE